MISTEHIRIENVYYMLAYAFRTLSEKNEYARVKTESFDCAEDLFGEILAIGLSGLVKRGIHRDYLEVNEDIAGIRGRIEMAATMRHRINHRMLVNCTHDEFSIDNEFNRILKTSAALLLRTGRLVKSGDRLKRAVMHLGDVSEMDPRGIRWSALRFQKSNAHYLMLINICRFVIEGLLMGDDPDGGDKTIRVFSFDEDRLCRLYEAFLRGYFARHFNLCAGAEQIDWALNDGDDGSDLPRMLADISLADGFRKLIIDAKFYSRTMQEHHGKYSVHSHNLYQILSYVGNAQVNEDAAGTNLPVSGMLLYARTDEAIQPDVSVTIAGHPIEVKTLDLACPFAEIAAQLDSIASKHFGKTGNCEESQSDCFI